MKLIRNKLYALYHPEQYHGWGKKRQYFEGWYYKVVNAAEDRAFAFIPGIAMDAHGHRHAFIQVMDGKQNTSTYLKYDASEFRPEMRRFSLSLGESQFEYQQITLKTEPCEGTLRFSDEVAWPVKWNSPGIMGPYAFVPFMECYHGILSMDHSISGEMRINGEVVDFTDGRGYIEKDWGVSFPSAYIWMQSNHFSVPGVSLKLSVANIPWLRSSFVGFIAGLWWQGRLIQFTTYNSSKLVRSLVNEDKVEIELQGKEFILQVSTRRTSSTELASPILGFMDGRINESMTARLEVKLVQRKTGQLVFKDIGRNAGLEVAGNIKEIITA